MGDLVNSCVIPYSFLFSVIAPSFLSTMVIPLKIKQKIKKNDADEEVNNVIDLEECNAYKVNDMMKDKDLCEALVVWMMREFSAENVLSFAELVQFKQYVVYCQFCRENRSTIAEAQTDTATVTAAATVEEEEEKYIDYSYDGMPVSSIIS